MITFFRKLFWFKQRRRKEDELREELQFHLNEETEQFQIDGLSSEQARWAAHRNLGNITFVNEEVREMWGWMWLERFWQDLRYAARGLFKSPVFTVISIFSLALGIGATATIFSVFEAVFFNGVTARDAERVRHVEMGEQRISYRQYRELSTDMPMLSGLAAYDQTSLSFGSGSSLEKVSGEVVSADFFNVLGVVPALGRTFTWSDNRPERQPQVVVLSHTFWERQFNADKSVLGSAIELNREPFTVIGVLSRGYRSIHGYGIAPEIYVPISPHLFGDLDNPDEARLELIGRLKDGVSVSQAQASVHATAHQLPRFQSDKLYNDKVQMYPLTGIEKMRRDGVPVELAVFFAFLLLAAVLVLLIACANVAGLLVARGVNRSREIAVRLALGAARYRLVQQLLTESLALALLGSGAGIAIYFWASKLIDRIQIRASVPLELHMVLDAQLLAFTVALALVATLLSGLAPALQTSKSRWHLGSNQIGAETRRGFSIRRWLVVGQFALAFVLLVSAALFLRSLARISHVDPGFDVNHLLTAEVNLNANSYPQARAEHYFETAISEISRLPGVRSVSGAAVVPLGIEHWVISMKAADHLIQRVHVNSVTPGYFQTMRIPLLRGRDFQASDRGTAPPVAIVNETFARKYLNDNPIDAQVSIPHPPSSPGAPPTWSRVQVIGVAADSKYGSLGEDPTPALYWPYSQEYRPLVLEVSLDTGLASALTPVRETLGRLDPHTPVKLQLVQERLAGALLPSRIASALLTTIGSLGLSLAAIGIYGIMAFSVSRRTAEIGMRLALGATQRQVLQMILRDALGLASVGMATGLVMALLFTRPLAGLLSAGMIVTDAFSFLAVGVVLSIVALIAAAIPAWRASQVDPILALRYQ